MKAFILLLVLSISQVYSQSLEDMVKASTKKSTDRIEKYEESRKAESTAAGKKYINVRDIDPVQIRKIDSVLKVSPGVIKYDIDKFLVALNEYRALNKLQPVVFNLELNAAAAHHAKYLRDGHHFYPESKDKFNLLGSHAHYESYPDNRSIPETFSSRDRARYYKYPYNSQMVGECTSGLSKRLLPLTGEIYLGALSSWKASPGHNAALLRENIKYIGIAAVYDKVTDMVFVVFDCGY